MPIIEYDEFSEFQQEHFMFQGQCAKVLIPAEKANGKWAIKTEYPMSSSTVFIMPAVVSLPCCALPEIQTTFI